MGRICGDAKFLLPVMVGAILLGFLTNALRAKPLPLVREAEDLRLARAVSENPLVEITQKPPVATPDDTVAALENEEIVFVDARDDAFFDAGHIPGARNLPRSAFQTSYADFATRVKKETPLIVYCSEAECLDSSVVAKALMRLGYRRAQVFKGGWEEWSAAGLPQEP